MADTEWNRLYYDEWVKREGIDLFKGYKIDNVFTQPLKPWARTGGLGMQIQLDGTGEMNAAYICEIPAGGQLKPQKHLYEEIVFILNGRGSTTVWYEGMDKNSFEWQAGSLFAIPLNAWHQHFNGTGQDPVRYLAVTTAPIMMNLIRNDDFIFNNDAVFPQRYRGEAEYFSGRTKIDFYPGFAIPGRVAINNFFADITQLELGDCTRGVETKQANLDMANGILAAHILEIPGGTFTKLHRHGPGAHVLWLQGEGYSFMWPEGGRKVKEHWGPGSMIVPPHWWWHQHCIVSKEPARHLALKLNSKRNMVTRTSLGNQKSTRQGGNQIDYKDIPEDVIAETRQMFMDECAKRGTIARMIEIDD